jgi:hypothetical protein
MYRRGLRNRHGGKVSLNGMSTILNNPFYVGIIRIKTVGEYFPGVHEPIVDRQTFDTVQLVLVGKTVVRTHRHEFLFSRMIRCLLCNRTVMAEVQKGHTYYRCHTKGCETKTIREERIDDALARAFLPLRLNKKEIDYARRWIIWARAKRHETARERMEACNLHLAQIRDRLSRLTDAFLDGAIDKAALDERRAALLLEQAEAKRQIVDIEAGDDAVVGRLEEYLELVETASNLYKVTQVQEKRSLVKKLTSNLSVGPKYAAITLHSAAQLIADRPDVSSGSPNRGVPRTWDRLLAQLAEQFQSPKGM